MNCGKLFLTLCCIAISSISSWAFNNPKMFVVSVSLAKLQDLQYETYFLFSDLERLPE